MQPVSGQIDRGIEWADWRGRGHTLISNSQQAVLGEGFDDGWPDYEERAIMVH
jgi:hypothetical protein